MTFDRFMVWSNLRWQYWKYVAWHLQISNTCFYQVSELWPMGLLFVTSNETKIMFLVCYEFVVLTFYGPVNPMESCGVRSVHLTALLVGRLSSLSG